MSGIRASRKGVAFNAALLAAGLLLIDVFCLGIAFLLSSRMAVHADPQAGAVWRATDGIFCVSLLYLTPASGGYAQLNQTKPLSQISRILVNATVIAMIEWLALHMLGQDRNFHWPWDGPINIVGVGALAMCGARLVVYRLLLAAAETGSVTRNIAVVGSGPHAQQFMMSLQRQRGPWTHIVGFFDDRGQERADSISELPVSGNVANLIDYARSNRVDEIVVALPWGAEDRLLEIFNKLRVIPANVRLAPDFIGHQFLDSGFDRLDGVPLYNIYVAPISGWSALIKRIEDLVLGSLLFVVAGPLLLACAIAIRIDSPGPILFRQRRHGYNDSLIIVNKFRTMHHDMRDDHASALTTKDDPRVTRVGRFLRRTSLDELPQLLNVLGGDMSLVGPRPHALQAKAGGRLYREIVDEYASRHKVKPGITGWAQVMGWRGETDTEEKIIRRVECDLYYMENWSIFLDIEILIRTVRCVFVQNENAY